jgi:hypothetical protein
MDMISPVELPPPNYRRIIDELSIVIADPVSKLRFIKQALDEHQHIPSGYRIYAPLAEIAFRKSLLDRVEKIRPGSRKAVKELTRRGVISAPHPKLLRLYKLRHAIGCIFLLVFVCGLSTAVASLFDTVNILLSLNGQPTHSWEKIIVRKPIHYPAASEEGSNPLELTSQTADDRQLLPDYSPELSDDALPRSALKAHMADNTLRPSVRSSKTADEPSQQPIAAQIELQTGPGDKAVGQVAQYLNQPIWLVEKTADCEIYSNSLQIFTTHTVSNIPRRYVRFNRRGPLIRDDPPVSNRIAGILYHASESDLVPFKPEMNASIKEKSKRLIRFIQREKSYHYLIDRFGRVYRLVQEDHAAFHAGNSVWADEKEIYLNLNHAFIGICFEGRDFEETENMETSSTEDSRLTSPRVHPTGISTLTEAQLRSGKELTEWLRVKYKIPQDDCVPHALASINPDKMLIGYHLDLSRGFPFEKFSLSDKYREPLPSIVEFGFSYDEYFEKIFDGNLWPGIRSSEEILELRSRHAGIRLAEYRKLLNDRFAACTQVRMAASAKNSMVDIARN